MKKITITSKNNMHSLVEVLKKSKSDNEIVFYFKKDSSIYKNSANLQTLSKIARENQKELKFEVEEEKHKEYIDAVNNDFVSFTDDHVDLNAVLDKSSIKAKKTVGPSKKIPLKILLSLIVLLFLVVGGASAALWYIPKATIELEADSEILVKLLDIKADINASEVSVETATIPALTVEVTEMDMQSIPTSGKKEVGEKATGEVVIFNKTDESKKLKKGSIINLISTAESGLSYELTEDVEIDAKVEVTETTAEGEQTVTTFGKSTVKIKALDFGDKYNQSSEQKFKIEGYDTDELIGENQNSIKGGSLTEIQVVAQEDLTDLERSLSEFLEKKALESLSKKIVEGQKLHESSVVYNILSKEFSGKVDDESKEVSLTISMKASGVVYSEDDLKEVVVELAKSIVPDRFRLDSEEYDYEVVVLRSSKDGIVDLQVKLRVNITPKFEEGRLKQDLSGMDIDDSKEYLDGLRSIKGYNIYLYPNPGGILKKLPARPENINIVFE